MLATLDFALTAEDRSFASPELRANLDRFLAPATPSSDPESRSFGAIDLAHGGQPSEVALGERCAAVGSEGEQRRKLAGGEQLVAERAW